MKELKNPCKELLEKGLCLGCNKLELDEFEGKENCIYARSIKVDGFYYSKFSSSNCNYDFTLFDN